MRDSNNHNLVYGSPRPAHHFQTPLANSGESSSLLPHRRITARPKNVFPNENGQSDNDDDGHLFQGFLPMSHLWFPDPTEKNGEPRSMRRRLFLFLTEPTTSIGSAIFFTFLILAIFMSNILMIMQTMNAFQFTPTDCRSCGGTVTYAFEDDATIEAPDPSVDCECPPTPKGKIIDWNDTVVYFFTVEWTMRVLMFERPRSEQSNTRWGSFCQWCSFLGETTTIMDALAIFPYYAERFEQTNGLMSLRLIRLFRVFQLVRLGQYNATFMSLQSVLFRAATYFKLLLIVLAFGAAFFGSIVYWLEKGDWEYNEDVGRYMFMRTAVDGVSKEPSPFTSIPAAFWWFLVTATTVGYGDTYPTSTGGKFVAALTMLAGVLVIAFPVSVFSDLWSKELKTAGAIEDWESIESDDPPKEVNLSFDQVSKQETNHKGVEAEASLSLSAEDVRAIRSYMKKIDESQYRIRQILEKNGIDA